LFVGNENQLTVVSESGLYKLIMRSDKATARPFQDWVTKEVLPAICKPRNVSKIRDVRGWANYPSLLENEPFLPLGLRCIRRGRLRVLWCAPGCAE
jgi:hypothetical protein